MKLLLDYALSFLGTPYLWGGDDPIFGYDCSGFIQELLMSVGMDPPGDQTAQALYNHFEKTASDYNKYGPGNLAFYGKSVTEITHVAMMLDTYRIIEAGGGGHTVTSITDAAIKNAFVRIRLLKYRPDLVAVIKPRYAPIGLV